METVSAVSWQGLLGAINGSFYELMVDKGIRKPVTPAFSEFRYTTTSESTAATGSAVYCSAFASVNHANCLSIFRGKSSAVSVGPWPMMFGRCCPYLYIRKTLTAVV